VVKVQEFYKFQDGKCKGAHVQNESFKRYLNFFQHISTQLYPIKFQCEALAVCGNASPDSDKALQKFKSGIIRRVIKNL
jgi:hypothetical protein